MQRAFRPRVYRGWWVRLKYYVLAATLIAAFFGVLMVTGRITDLSAFFSDLLERLGLDSVAEV